MCIIYYMCALCRLILCSLLNDHRGRRNCISLGADLQVRNERSILYCNIKKRKQASFSLTPSPVPTSAMLQY